MLAIAGNAVYSALVRIMGPEAAAVIMVVIAVVTLDFDTMASSFASIANLANMISQVYFTFEMKDVMTSLTHTQEEIENEQKAIDEMRKDFLYIPLDSYSSYYSASYDLLYNAYDGSQEALYNYDRMLKPNIGVMA
jgi:predicted PurR-regulated permease PerM